MEMIGIHAVVCVGSVVHHNHPTLVVHAPLKTAAVVVIVHG